MLKFKKSFALILLLVPASGLLNARHVLKWQNKCVSNYKKGAGSRPGEVMVVGYGTRRRAEVTSSISPFLKGILKTSLLPVLTRQCREKWQV
jgi:hypothetical protein